MDLLTSVALALLALGVLSTVYFRIPGAAFSLLGVYIYWWGSDFAEPGLLTLSMLSVVGALALAAQLYALFVADRLEGASRIVVFIAAIVGFASFLFTGTSGMLVGVVVTVFFLEYIRRRSMKRSFVAVFLVIFGSISSKLIQLLLTGVMFLVMIQVAFL